MALGLSAGIAIGSFVLAPVVIAQLPADYFQEQRRQRNPSRDRRPVLQFTLASLQNLFGVTLIVAGAAMIPLPGQGLLTMAIGVGLVEFPGKQRLVNALVSRPMVLDSLNWIRAKARKAPFMTPATD
jgi:hypothetical protein